MIYKGKPNCVWFISSAVQGAWKPLVGFNANILESGHFNTYSCCVCCGQWWPCNISLDLIQCWVLLIYSLIARFVRPTWGLSGADRTQMDRPLTPITYWRPPRKLMMTSSKQNSFHITDPLCRIFTSQWWILFTKASDAKPWCFLWAVPEQTVD